MVRVSTSVKKISLSEGFVSPCHVRFSRLSLVMGHPCVLKKIHYDSYQAHISSSSVNLIFSKAIDRPPPRPFHFIVIVSTLLRITVTQNLL